MYVYILRCEDNSLYTGITADLEKRIRQHIGLLKGGAKYTRSHPVKYIEAVWLT
ncbi:MAG: GIY-YIG nuclease family protein, partial [Porcipelethomonas sp.]